LNLSIHFNPKCITPSLNAQPNKGKIYKGANKMEDLQWIWKAITIVIVGTLILRVSGRKSISQLTVPQTIIMISIGTIMIQPVSERNIWVTFLIALVLVATLITMEFLQTKSDFLENILTGKARIVIENGKLNLKNLDSLRLTIDQLEMRLRQANVSRYKDIKIATIEPSGQLGYELIEESQYATKGDIQAILNYIHQNIPNADVPPQITQQNQTETLFSEVQNKRHYKKPNPILD